MLERRIATVITHEQSVASDTWTIVHNLHDYPIVDVFINNNGAIEKIIPSAVEYVDMDTVTVSFSAPRAGFARIA